MAVAEMKHLLLISYPAQGHVNPLLRFGKIIASHGFLVTFCTSGSAGMQMCRASGDVSDRPQPIGDGFLRFAFFDDEREGNAASPMNHDHYLSYLRLVGTSFVSKFVAQQAKQNTPVSVLINNPFISWVLDLGEKLKIPTALFWTNSCACLSGYYHYSHSSIRYPTEEDPFVDVELPAMPVLKHDEIPSFLHPSFPNPGLRRAMVEQKKNMSKASWVFIDSFHELESEVVDYMSKIYPVMTVGPMVRNSRLSLLSSVRGDFFKAEDDCVSWLDSRPVSSVVYICLGTVVQMKQEQVDEMAYGLLESGVCFLWVKKPSLVSAVELTAASFGEKGKIVAWSPQEEVLKHRAISCIVTHCGWNSTMEAISSGVPVVAYSQWGDQVMNSKFLVDVFKMGVMMCRNNRDDRLISRYEIAKCLIEATVGSKATKIKENALKWKAAAEAAIADDGSSQCNIAKFVDQLKA